MAIRWPTGIVISVHKRSVTGFRPPARRNKRVHSAPDRVVDGGDDVIVLGRYGSTIKQGGASLDFRSCHA